MLVVMFDWMREAKALLEARGVRLPATGWSWPVDLEKLKGQGNAP